MRETKNNKMMKKTNILSIFIAVAMIFTLANFNPISAQQTVEDQFWNLVKDSKYVEDFDSYLKEYPKGKYAVIAGLRKRQISREQTSKQPTSANQTNYLITNSSVGDLKLGMTVAEARKAMNSAKFARYFGSEQALLISVYQGDKHILTLGTGEEERIEENGKESPINENGKIQYIEILDSRFKTADAVHPGMTLADSEKKYGKIKSIYRDAHIGEIGEFTNQPEGFDFIFVGKESDSEHNEVAGIYNDEGNGTTSKYLPGAYIYSISIKNFEAKNETVKFSSSFSNFTTDCKLVDEEGAGRNECKTPADTIFVSSNPILTSVSMGNDFLGAKNLFSQSFDSEFQKHNIEWRLADGEAFAFNIHLYDYNLHDEGKTAKRTGLEYFAVKGLGGYSFIDFQIPIVGNPNAAEEARQQADEMYRNGEEVSLQYTVNMLRGGTNVPLRIPTYITPDENTKKFFASNEPFSETEYLVYFDFTPGCGGSTPCAWTSISGKKLVKNDKTPKGKTAKLANNITGYFEDLGCATTCWTTLTWDENGYRYTITSKVGEINEFIKMANSAINRDTNKE